MTRRPRFNRLLARLLAWLGIRKPLIPELDEPGLLAYLDEL